MIFSNNLWKCLTLFHFRGLSQSHIYFNATLNKWVIRSIRDTEKYLVSNDLDPNDLPLGTHLWQLGTENSLCGKKAGHVMKLTFSTCYPNKYTCDSGHCIGKPLFFD